MSGALRVGLVGAGYFAQFHAEAWRRIAGARLVAVCDQRPDAAGRIAADGEAVFAGVDQMLDAVELDLLDIATPPASHLELVERGAAAGLAMVCQKPLAPTIEAAAEIVAIADNAGVLLVVHENFRFQPWYREAKRMLDAGLFGVPLNISFRLRPGDGQGPDAYLARQPYFQKMQRFLVHETAIHLIDTFRYLLGEIVAVTARLRRLNPAIAGEDAGLIVTEFASGAAGLFDGNRLIDHAADNPRLTMGECWLEGSEAVLRLDGDGRLFLRPRHGDEREHAYHWQDQAFGGDCVAALQRHVVAHLRDGAALENQGRDYLRNIEIEQAVYRSNAEGRRIALPSVG